MAYTLNTSHPLYGNLVELIGVQGGALVSHKTARTFTLDSSPAPSFGTGTWGEHFVFAKADSATSKGASFSPAISFSTYANPTYSVFVAVNTKGTVTYDAVLINGSLFAPFLAGSNVRAGVSITNRISGSTSLGSGARSLCATATIGTSGNLYLDGVSEGTPYGSNPDTERPDAGFNGIGRTTGNGAADGCSVVWIAVFDKVLTSAEVLALHNSLGASNAFALVSSGDTTAPTLTSASVTAVGTTTGTGNVTTDEGNGTLYSIVSTSATAPSAAQIQAGQNHTGAAAVWSGNQAVSSTGAKTFSITGLTASTAYYAHFQHKDAANNNSTVVTSAQFTTGSTDTTVPTLTGSITISSKTTTSYTATWPSGSDNVAVTGYEYRLNAGSWVDVGNVLTTNINARTLGSTDTFEVRAYDTAGNKSTPSLSVSVTLLIGTITIPAVKDWSTGNLKTAQTGVQVDIHNISTGALVVRKTGQTTHATTGVCVVQDAALSDATTYEVITRFTDGSKGMWDYTATNT